jgi:hypothetical protein
MPTSAQRTLPLQATRPGYRSVEGWAIGTLIEHGALVECEHHGHRRDRADPNAWTRAREEAWRNRSRAPRPKPAWPPSTT